MPKQILAPINEVLELRTIKKSTHYSQVSEGLFVPPILVGKQAKRYVLEEVQIMINAQIAGKSAIELKALVSELVTKRQEAA